MIGDASPVTAQDVIVLGWLFGMAMHKGADRITEHEAAFIRMMAERWDIVGTDMQISNSEREQIEHLLEVFEWQELAI
jgi:hypothetical protein